MMIQFHRDPARQAILGPLMIQMHISHMMNLHHLQAVQTGQILQPQQKEQPMTQLIQKIMKNHYPNMTAEFTETLV